MPYSLSIIRVGIAAISLLVFPAFAHMGSTGIVKERMEMMSALGKTMKSLRAMAKGHSAIDTIFLSQAAQAISGHSERMPDLFPAGTFDAPSEALPAIDDRRDEFDDFANRLRGQGTILAKLAGAPDPESLQNWYRDTGRLCSACHKHFREKRQ